MSIQLYVGHTGQRLSLELGTESTLDAVRLWISEQAAIRPRDQILLTSQGKQVRAQTLLTETELFVFDSTRLSSKNVASPLSASVASSASNDFNPGTPPDTLSNQNDLRAWQNLFRVRKSWASGLLNGCDTRAKQAQQYQSEQAVIERSLGVAVASLQQHLRTAEQRYVTAETWSEELLQQQEAHLGGWEEHLDSLRNIPARAEFARFINPPVSGSRKLPQQSNSTTLQGFIDVAATTKAASTAKTISGTFGARLTSMHEDLQLVSRDSEQLLQVVEQINDQSHAQDNSEPVQLLEEIEMMAKKMSSDLEHVQSLPRTSQSIAQVSKLALLHTRNYLPNLREYCNEMNELVVRTRQERDSAAQTAQEHMQTLSAIESRLSELYSDTKKLEVPQDDQQAFATLSIIARLPSVYGQLLVESVRRREWVAKMRRDSATLQEEVATYQEEEDKRRKKWIRSVEDVVNLDALQNNVLGIELSLQNEGNSWPMVTREELQSYLETLVQNYGQGEVTDEMDEAIKALDKPTRKQIKHARAFKNGSMHEAAFGDTSLFLRGDEQHKDLRDTNIRLEEELKGQRSRVRKLEDLLHRQGQASRPSIGDMFTPQSGTFSDRLASPIVSSSPQAPGNFSQMSSQRPRRLSSTQAIEEKKLARRVVDLEAELQAAREDAVSRKNSDAEAQKQVEEAVSTKKDLMENMEAQQREFADERRNLERELADAKEKIEEMENEFERLLGSRDDERTGIDTRITTFEEEVSRLKEDAQGHAARAATEYDARIALEQKLEQADKAKTLAEEELQKMKTERGKQQEAESEQLQLLATAHSHLASEVDIPIGLAALSIALEEFARKSAAHAKDLAEAVSFAKCENESLWSSNERQKSELANATQKQADLEDELRSAKEGKSTEHAKTETLEQQLADEKAQLRDLRSKFAEGETGSEVLRQRIAEEETTVGRLSSELAEAKVHINSMDIELTRLQKNHRTYHARAEETSARLDKRAERAKDLSQRIYSQITRLARTMERLGFVVTYQDDTMVVERASKLAASTNMGDTQPSLNRTVSVTSPPPTRKSSAADDYVDLSILRWPDARTLEEETTQFEAFLQTISRFNVDTFSEAIVKRVRDFEYTCRKYTKDAREAIKKAELYKERSVKLKGEASTKIAVREFKEGDLALFLPTRGQPKGAWAAFNIGCPHYFLAEKEGMRLGSRDFIVARISKVEQKVVDLSRALTGHTADGRSIDETSEAPSIDDDNPFDLSDGLTWWLVHATEERGAGGAPSTPGLAKTTVAAANVDATGSIRINRGGRKTDDASKHLNKSLDSRRSSSTSKKSVAGATNPALVNTGSSPPLVADSNTLSVNRPSSSHQHTPAKPPPSAAATSSGPSNEDRGMTVSSDADAQPTDERVYTLSTARRDGWSCGGSPSKPPPARQRSKSPSKSVRSLQRHLEQPAAPHSPAKSPARTPAAAAKTMSPTKQQKSASSGWESLWQAEFALEGSATKDADK